MSVVGSAAATETEREKKTNNTSRNRRLRRTANVVKVDRIEDADRSKQEEAAVENIHRILNDERTNNSSTSTRIGTSSNTNNISSNDDNRQLLEAGIIAEINNKRVVDDQDVLYLMTHVLQHNERQFFSMPPKPVS